MRSLHSFASPDLMVKYKRQTYLLAFPFGVLITLLFVFLVAKKELPYYIALCMIAELALLFVLVLLEPRSIPFVDIVFYFSYTSYFFVITFANLNYAILDGSFNINVLGENVNSLAMWTIVFMVGAYLALSPNHVKILFGYIFVVVTAMAIQNLWILDSYGGVNFDILFRWINPVSGLAMTGLLIQRVGVLQQKQATTDALTGLLNRHALYRILEHEMERSVRYGNPFSIILFDVDHFKEINDTHGHLAGDNVLKSLSDLAGKAVRQVDYIGRWGGEEFLVILPDTESTPASALAERLCQMVKETHFGKAEHVTASFGVTTYQSGRTLEELLHIADHAMYQAKQNGRGQVAGNFRSSNV